MNDDGSIYPIAAKVIGKLIAILIIVLPILIVL